MILPSLKSLAAGNRAISSMSNFLPFPILRSYHPAFLKRTAQKNAWSVSPPKSSASVESPCRLRYNVRDIVDPDTFVKDFEKCQQCWHNPEGEITYEWSLLDRQIKKPDENPSVGLLLCASKNDEVVEYAMSRTLSPMMVAEYQLHLPDKDVLRKKLQEFVNLPAGAEE